MGCGGREGIKGREGSRVWEEKGLEEKVLVKLFYLDFYFLFRSKKM